MKRLGVLVLALVLGGCEIFLPPWDTGPSVSSVDPENGATNVSVGTQVTAELDLPNGGLSLTTVGEQSVRLTEVGTGQVVPATIIPDNDANRLTLDPVDNLAFSTEYRFTISSAVSDESGAAFREWSSTFTTIGEGVPFVISSSPADGATDVPLNTGVAAQISTDGGVDPSSITESSVYLVEVSSGARVPSNAGTSGGGDIITLQPRQPLQAQTEYQFNVTSDVRDLSGEAFAPYTATFITGNTGIFDGDVELTPQPTAARERHASLEFGPDGNLYAAMIDGRIRRYPVADDGTLGSPTEITTLLQAEGGPRLTIGLAFDPASTASNPIVWVTHTFLDLDSFNGNLQPGIDEPWSGKLSRLSGPNLENIEDVVIGLPRSNKDHVTNSVAFNPAEPGVVYFVQGSNTAMGAPDRTWGFQEERTLSGAVLRLDTNLLGSLPLNAQTEDGGTYDPYAPGAPLTVYGSGTRNSYDLVWHSNGNLYVPANGSNRGGVVPRYDPIPGTCENRPDGGYSGPILDSPDDVPDATYLSDRTDGWTIDQTLSDYLFKIEEGGYYGTPNPKRCEWILNGGGVGVTGYPNTRVEQYPSSVLPDPNYRGPAGDFGVNVSPNGSIEYRGSAFGGLQGQLLVTRYSLYDDIVAVTLGSDGNATSFTSITPAGGFIDPIDITESPETGYLYVSAYDANSGQAATRAGIVLVRPGQ